MFDNDDVQAGRNTGFDGKPFEKNNHGENINDLFIL
jgi:hypothetical protein